MSGADVVIVDYGMGNVESIRNMFARIGASASLSGDPDVIARSPRVLLPGVGAFDVAARALRATGLDDALAQRRKAGVGPVLGVCLGMQLLFDASDEGTDVGLGFVSGRCHRFPAETGDGPLRVPHMGWKEVQPRSAAVFPSIGPDSRFYFVHSYYVDPVDSADIAATSMYGVEFASIVARDQVVGVQFHPEKSHRHGLRLLADFLAFAA